jgi:hypothetical protein
MQKLEASYQKSLQGLEEIQILGGKDISPLIGNVSYHISELKRKAIENIDKNHSYQHLNNFLANHIELMFIDYIKKSKKLNQAQIYFSDHTWGNKEWDSVLKILPEMLRLLDLIQLHNNIQLIQEREVFKLRGWIGEDSSIESKRAEIYTVFRKLLKEKIILTYEIIETVKYKESIIEIVFDLSHDENLIYKVEGANKLSNVSFSNVFKNYEVLITEKIPCFKHNVLQINERMQLQKTTSIKKNIEKGTVVIHFPFMFQPVSFIIPTKGEVVELEKKSINKNYIDVFNLIVES